MNVRRIISYILIVSLALIVGCGNNLDTTVSVETTKDPNRVINVGIAWKCNDKPKVYESTISALETVGANPIVLEQVVDNNLSYDADKVLTEDNIDLDGDLTDSSAEEVKTNTYNNSNVTGVMNNIDAVIFLGGEDISPSLYLDPEPVNNGSDPKDTVNPTRDVSDYLLMNYCLDNDIPIMGICRGMQMLAVVSGGKLIQDLASYYSSQGKDYVYYHRMAKNSKGEVPEYARHDVAVDIEDSILYNIIGSDIINNVPSWHHQAVNCDGVGVIKITGSTTYNDISVPEVIERTDKKYVIGYQFHPEAVIEKLNKQGNYTDYTNTSIMYGMFKSLVDNAR